ncbi:MAG: hypothetical protein ACK58J_21715, partial [Planctomyces sp.]
LCPLWLKKHRSQAILPGQISGWKARATKITKPQSPLVVDFVSFVDQTQPMRSIRENPCSSVEKKQPQHKIKRHHKQWRIRHLHNFFAPGLRPGVSETTEDRGAE